MSIVEFKIREKIKKAINRVEQESSCELVAVLAKKSYNYAFIALMTSAMLAMVVPAFLMLFKLTMDAITIYQIQVISFVIFFLLFNIDYVTRLLMPKSIMKRFASRKAHESFVTLGLHQTSNNQAVMIFVSLFEHFVEIIVDVGVSEKIPNTHWEDIVSKFTDDVKNGDFELGYLGAIESIGYILNEQFPRIDDSATILPNRLIEI